MFSLFGKFVLLLCLLWFNPAAGNSAPDSLSLTPPLCPQRDGEKKWTKGKTHGLRARQFNKTTKEKYYYY